MKTFKTIILMGALALPVLGFSEANCVSSSNGNASRHCSCKSRSGWNHAATSDCLPESDNYERYGSVSSCLAAFNRACTNGAFSVRGGSIIRRTSVRKIRRPILKPSKGPSSRLLKGI